MPKKGHTEEQIVAVLRHGPLTLKNVIVLGDPLAVGLRVMQTARKAHTVAHAPTSPIPACKKMEV
jgi:hypothetical protein